ncbi:hypothetical protein G3N92_10255 [Burkholderia sp. Ac-20379]|nr:hypothetical protein [Burkholderia sp. Ac-20379]
MIAPASITELERPLRKVLRIPYRKRNEAKWGALTFLCDAAGPVPAAADKHRPGAAHNLRRIDWFAAAAARHIVMGRFVCCCFGNDN